MVELALEVRDVGRSRTISAETPESTRQDTARAGGEPPREGAWGAAGVGLLLGLFILAVLATLHGLMVTLG